MTEQDSNNPEITDNNFTLDTHSCANNKLKCQNLKLSVFDWMEGMPLGSNPSDLIEVQFKNTRKGYFRNTTNLPLERGEMVAVESSPGHDIGIVTLIGELVSRQLKKNNLDTARYEIKRVYRKAKPTDLEKWEKAKSKEHGTMLRSRQIAKDLGLNMKIGDVEYQGDGNKAIFYYIADERVDFRQLIRVLAEEFRIRVEMKQIGARQEAGRIGGIGPCGRELCCSSWMTKFSSVSTNSARQQELSLNPQKLAGQCAKLKCCLNYELDGYVEAKKQLPNQNIPLETEGATYYHFKTDVFKQEITYSAGRDSAMNMATISAKRAKEIIEMNKEGKRPDKLEANVVTKAAPKKLMGYENVVGQDELTRFDSKKPKSSHRHKKSNRNRKPNDNRKKNDNRKPNDNRNKKS